jgi:hypothetical protein
MATLRVLFPQFSGSDFISVGDVNLDQITVEALIAQLTANDQLPQELPPYLDGATVWKMTKMPKKTNVPIGGSGASPLFGLGFEDGDEIYMLLLPPPHPVPGNLAEA